VPRYQRSYAWKKEEVREFWDDINRAIDEDASEYFLGTVVFSGGDLSQGSELPAVVDGQQRLVTASLLFAALRDVFLENDMKERVEIIERFLSDRDTLTLALEPRLTLNEENQEYFEATQLPPPGKKESFAPKGASNRKISDASVLLRSLVDKLVEDSGNDWEQVLVKLQLYVRDRSRVVVLDVPDEANAYLIFETLNDRGLDLTIADLLKNYLFSRAGTKIETVKQNWDRAIGALDAGDDDKLQTTFLRHYWSSQYGYTREKELYRSIKKRVMSKEEAVKFSRELVDAAKQYSALRNPSHPFWSDYGTPTRANLETLLMLDMTQSRPLLLAVMQQWKPGQVGRTLKHLVAWSVRFIVVGGAGSGTTEKAFSDRAVEVRNGKLKDAKALAEGFSSIVPDDAQFEAAFSFTSKKARHARYFLHALQRSAEGGQKNPELISNADETQVSLEHILPREPDPGAWPQFTPEQHAELFNRLGNEVLLNARTNGALGSKSYAEKKPIYEESELGMTREAAEEFEDWTPEAIANRQIALAELAVTAWPR
jgi:Protein of unknown function DUF262/Protein of unknown function (DUF1524)